MAIDQASLVSTFRPSVDYEAHKTLENDVRQFLEQNNFFVEELTYHSRLPKNVSSILSGRYSPTALYLRGRADRIAIHKFLPIEFEWEAKTHQSQKYKDLTIEALPLSHHVSKSFLGVDCIYIYRNPFEKIDCGFWTYDIPNIRIINIPDRWDISTKGWFREVLSDSFPDVLIADTNHVNGSGDPYAIIDKSEVDKLQDWKSMILELVDIARAHERGVLIRRATLANKRRGKMAKEKVCQAADKAREAQG